MVPTGFPYREAKLCIGAGVLVDPDVLLKEIEMLKEFNVKERLTVDYRCGIIEERHKIEDREDKHLSEEIGTTGTGCGPANRDRVLRILKQAKDIDELKDYLGDVSEIVNDALDEGKDVLIEGTQGTFLSLYYGTYPYVTSKDTTASSFAADIGIGPTKVDEVIVVFKSFPTRVGAGPFPTEMSLEEAEKLGIVEYGTVTGRRRRVGYFDFDLARKACRLNGATQIALTGLDKYDKSCYGVREFEKLSDKAKEFIEKIEDITKVPVTLISTGPEMKQIIDLRKEKL